MLTFCRHLAPTFGSGMRLPQARGEAVGTCLVGVESGAAEELGHALTCLTVGFAQHAGVDVEGEGDGRVAEPF
jgi:hypothetical protein